MDVVRYGLDLLYDIIKPAVFLTTSKDPEKAHELFISFCQFLHKTGLEKIVLDNKSNKIIPPFELSNAAGFNKNGEIHPFVLQYLGFDRVVIGTITNDAWPGNPRPRCKRYTETESLVNWMGFPGEGSQAVAERLVEYGKHEVPLTINFMSTPQKHGDELLRDLESTILNLRDHPYVDRFELNISCPNTPNKYGRIDARDEHQKQLDNMLTGVEGLLHPSQELYIKVSPDLDVKDVNETIAVSKYHLVNGFTISNISTEYNNEKGGVSGNAVYDSSSRVQNLFQEYIIKNNKSWKIIACGGINSIEKAKERLSKDTTGIQIFTPLIFSGTKILRELRRIKV